MANLKFHVCFLFFCASSLNLVCCHSLSKDHVAFFLFGDSLFDSGNNNYINTIAKANFWPYGETLFKYPTGRFSDGRLIPDFIAEYAKLPLIPPYLQPGNHHFSYGVNFASAGAGALVETNKGLARDLKTQIGYFKYVAKQLRLKLGDAKAERVLSKAVYFISIGTNDYVYPILTNSTVPKSLWDEYVGTVIGNLTTNVKEIYNVGERKFGFLSPGQLGGIPILRMLVTALRKQALTKALQELQSQLEGFKYANHNSSVFLSEIVEEPSKLGEKIREDEESS
ncbi:hypothetical protein SLE2022_307620 [Rubroshorea leprosula]